MKQYRNEYKCVSETKHQIPNINTISEPRTFKIRIIFSLLFFILLYLWYLELQKMQVNDFFF